MRYAIYYAPPQNDPLTRKAESWLGRSAFTGETLEVQALGGWSAEEIAARTASARRYGFHATLVAPFELAERETEASLQAALAEFAAAWEPFPTPPLRIGRLLGGFFALEASRPCPDLSDLAQEALYAFDGFRAPLSAAEKTRRAAGGLTPSQAENLDRWGYPYVLGDFRFHMTLTDRIAEEEAERMEAALEAHFAEELAAPRRIASIALFQEPEKGAPFLIRAFQDFASEPETEAP